MTDVDSTTGLPVIHRPSADRTVFMRLIAEPESVGQCLETAWVDVWSQRVDAEGHPLWEQCDEADYEAAEAKRRDQQNAETARIYAIASTATSQPEAEAALLNTDDPAQPSGEGTNPTPEASTDPGSATPSEPT